MIRKPSQGDGINRTRLHVEPRVHEFEDSDKSATTTNRGKLSGKGITDTRPLKVESTRCGI